MKFFSSLRTPKAVPDPAAVSVSEKSGVRSLHIGSDTIQSSMRLSRPNDLELAYTRSMMAALLFNPAPRDVLMIGLGGGSFAKFVYHRLPQAHTVVVEIDPRVIKLARDSFCLPPDDARLRVILGDGAAYLASGGRCADLLMVDGYDSVAQVAAVASVEFYRNCESALSDAGVLAVNLWGGARDFDDCVARMRSAFGGRVACLPAGKPGNVAAFAFKRSAAVPRWDDLRARAQALKAELGLDFPRFVEQFELLNPHDAERLLV